MVVADTFDASGAEASLAATPTQAVSLSKRLALLESAAAGKSGAVGDLCRSSRWGAAQVIASVLRAGTVIHDCGSSAGRKGERDKGESAGEGAEGIGRSLELR